MLAILARVDIEYEAGENDSKLRKRLAGPVSSFYRSCLQFFALAFQVAAGRTLKRTLRMCSAGGYSSSSFLR